jgi:CheY-like chemotaxis protein
MMPMVDGFATLEQIKKKRLFALQGHFLSAKKGEEDIKKDFHLGANLYVTKPFQ